MRPTNLNSRRANAVALKAMRNATNAMKGFRGPLPGEINEHMRAFQRESNKVAASGRAFDDAFAALNNSDPVEVEEEMRRLRAEVAADFQMPAAPTGSLYPAARRVAPVRPQPAAPFVPFTPPPEPIKRVRPANNNGTRRLSPINEVRRWKAATTNANRAKIIMEGAPPHPNTLTKQFGETNMRFRKRQKNAGRKILNWSRRNLARREAELARIQAAIPAPRPTPMPAPMAAPMPAPMAAPMAAQPQSWWPFGRSAAVAPMTGAVEAPKKGWLWGGRRTRRSRR